MAREVKVGEASRPIHEEVHYGRSVTDPEAQVFLQPIAAPSILGLFGLAGATLMVGAFMAGWYGGEQTPLYLLPFATFFGGLAQFLSAMWAYRARDGLATAVHGMWGSFWMSFGLLYLMFGFGVINMPAGPFPELGFWFIVLSAITLMTTIAAMGQNWGLFGVLALLTVASALAAIASWTGSVSLLGWAGWAFVISAVIAWYTASALMIESTFGRAILPVGRTKHAKEIHRFHVGYGEPGVTHGQ